MQLRNILNDQRPSAQGSAKRSMKEILLLLAPPIVVVALALYLVIVCYPNALFLWGDSIGRYETLKQTRTLLWSIIIGTTVVGVLTNVFREGLTSWLSRQ